MKKFLITCAFLTALPVYLCAADGGDDIRFSILNWLIIAVFLIATTVIGERLKGKNRNLNDFFLGGKSVPWWAVSFSMIATKTSVSTFIAVPAFVFSAAGNLTYLQMTLGFILGNFLFVFVLLKQYYQEGVYSPYDFIQNRLGTKTSQLSRSLFMLGATLSQGVRLLGTALVLSVITGLDTLVCILIIVVFSIIWSYLGGITTVIWTDVIQFIIFFVGALFALFYATGAIPGGLGEMLAIADEKAKLIIFDLSMNPRATYTLWVGLLGCTFFEFGSNAVDQVVTQRALCCKNVKEAQKAVALSAIGAITTYIMAFVGLALVAFYDLNPLSEEMKGIVSAEPDRIFPHFVVTQIPNGISGLIIAAMFAAGISTLDSALAALSQTTCMGIIPAFFPKMKKMSENQVLKASRLGIVFWGIILGLLAYVFSLVQAEGLLSLGFKMPGYVYGILIGIAFLSLMRKGRFRAIVTGALLAVIVIIFLNYEGVATFWWYPVGAIVVMAVALADHYLITRRYGIKGQ